jgi:hypothetical protein
VIGTRRRLLIYLREEASVQLSSCQVLQTVVNGKWYFFSVRIRCRETEPHLERKQLSLHYIDALTTYAALRNASSHRGSTEVGEESKKSSA